MPVTVIESYEGSINVVYDMEADDTVTKEEIIELQSQKLSQGIDLGFPILDVES